MNIDAAPFEVRAGIRRQDLHVARQHQQLRIHLLEQLDDALLLLGFATIDHRQVVKRNAVPLGEAAQILVVGDDRDDFNGQRSGAVSMQHAVEAVSVLRDRDHGAALALDFVEFPGHAEAIADGMGESPIQLL